MRAVGLLLAASLLLAGFFRVSDNRLMGVVPLENKPYYLAEDAVVADLDGLGLTYGELRYHAYRVLTGDAGLTPAQADLQYDETLRERLLQGAVSRAAYWRALSLLAMELELEPPEATEAYRTQLQKQAYMTGPVAAAYARAEALFSLGFAARYGQSGEALSASEAESWAADNGVMRLRAVWLNGDPAVYSQAELDGRLAQLEIFARQLRRGEASFDDLCDAYTEDARWSAGRQFTQGGVSEALYQAAASLPVDDCGAFLLEDGVFLLLRCPPEADEAVETDQGKESSLRYLAAKHLWSRTVEEKAASMTLHTRRSWRRLDVRYLF